MISSVAFTACSGAVVDVEGSIRTKALLSGVWCEAEEVTRHHADDVSAMICRRYLQFFVSGNGLLKKK